MELPAGYKCHDGSPRNLLVKSLTDEKFTCQGRFKKKVTVDVCEDHMAEFFHRVRPKRILIGINWIQFPSLCVDRDPIMADSWLQADVLSEIEPFD